MIDTSTSEQVPAVFRPVIALAAALAAGICLGAHQPGHLPFALIGFGIAAAATAWSVWRNRPAVIRPLILIVMAGYLSLQPWLADHLPENHVSRFVDRGYWRIQGVVAGTPAVKRGRWNFQLAAGRLTHKDTRYEVCGMVRVTGRGAWPGARRGDHVIFRGHLKSIRSFSNPGGFDYERFMKFKGIRARVYASARSLKIESAAPSDGLLRHMDKLRDHLSGQMDDALSQHNPNTRGLLKGLILGDRSCISDQMREQFNQAGVGHVLAISGLHVGMVAAVSFALAKLLLAWLPGLVKRAWVHKGAALLSLGPVLVYGILSGLSPSTQRAMLMVAVFMAGFWVGRRHDWLNTLAAAALVILVVYPPALFGISFQLSFSAVAAIIAGGRFSGREKGMPDSALWKKLLRHLLSLLWISAMAILGTLPLVLHHFNQVSLVGPAVNLVVVPLVGMVVVPSGLLGTLGAVISPGLGAWGWHIAALGADLIGLIVQFISSWSWASVKCVTPNGFEIALYYIVGVMLIFWRKLPRRTVLAAMVTSICLLDVGYWVYQRYGREDLRVTVLDVGQASANLLELPLGYTVLVDGGGYSDNSIFDVGASVVAPLLWRKKIRTVDLVVLSHANSDHLNGLLYILSHFNVGEVWSNQEPAKTRAFGRWTQLLARRKICHPGFEQMPRQATRNGVRLEILAPPAGFLKAGAPWRDLNNNSLVLRVKHGNVSYLFPGDIMGAAEADLVARSGGEALRSTVLVVPHHGSRTSSTEQFLQAVNPKEAVVSAGWQNRFGFPHSEALERIRSAGCRLWCTADMGAIEIVTDGKSYRIAALRYRRP